MGRLRMTATRSRWWLWLPALSATAWLSACETTAPYADCPLDKEVTNNGICTGVAGSTSCVVRRHPQCEQNICLSYYGVAPVCTKECSQDSDCPTENGAAATCWIFAPADTGTGKGAEKYCVPKSRKDAKEAADKTAGK